MEEDVKVDVEVSIKRWRWMCLVTQASLLYEDQIGVQRPTTTGRRRGQPHLQLHHVPSRLGAVLQEVLGGETHSAQLSSAQLSSAQLSAGHIASAG